MKTSPGKGPSDPASSSKGLDAQGFHDPSGLRCLKGLRPTTTLRQRRQLVEQGRAGQGSLQINADVNVEVLIQRIFTTFWRLRCFQVYVLGVPTYKSWLLFLWDYVWSLQ